MLPLLFILTAMPLWPCTCTKQVAVKVEKGCQYVAQEQPTVPPGSPYPQAHQTQAGTWQQNQHHQGQSFYPQIYCGSQLAPHLQATEHAQQSITSTQPAPHSTATEHAQQSITYTQPAPHSTATEHKQQSSTSAQPAPHSTATEHK
jgi:hypothetical protein